MPAPADASRSESGHRRSAPPDFVRGGVRVSQVTRSSPSYVPWSNTPPVRSPPRPSRGRGRCGLRALQRSRHRKLISFEAVHHGPHARVTTLRRCRYRHRRKPRYGLGALTLSQAGFAPARRRLRVSVQHRGFPSSLSRIACSHWSSHRPLPRQPDRPRQGQRRLHPGRPDPGPARHHPVVANAPSVRIPASRVASSSRDRLRSG